MNASEYAKLDATALAELLKKGEVTPQEITALAERALDAMNQKLNFIAERFSPISGNAAGRFAGVPFVAKDLSLHIKGVPHHAGTRMLAGNRLVPTVSSELFARLQAAGLTTLATTTTPEFGFNTTCEAIAYGAPTRNPWNTTKSSGGSSGGSCVAVVTGAVPIAHANDGAGSIRIPASLCGLVGLKPSRGRVPSGSDSILPVMGLSAELGVSRSVRDSAALLDIMQGQSAGAYHASLPTVDYSSAIQQATPTKRIAVMTHLKGTAQPSEAMQTALHNTATILGDMEHQIEYASPDYDYDTWLEANFIAFYSTVSAEVHALAETMGIKPDTNNFESVTLRSAELGASLSVRDIHRGWQMISQTCQSIGQFMQGYDALLLPTTKGAAISLGVLNQNDANQDANTWPQANFAQFPYTALFNMTGQPAISVPCGLDAGLPLGVQLVGKIGDETTLLQLASDLEIAQPWAHHFPEVHISNM